MTWQKFRGEPGAEGTLKVKEPKRDKLEIFNEALKEAAKEPKGAAVTSKKKADKAEEPKAEEPKAAAAPAEVPASETPEGAAEEAETAETVTAEDAGKSEA